MRVVTSPNFCKACIEGLWLSLLKRVTLIDNMTESCTRVTPSNGWDNWVKSFTVDLVPLAHLRLAGSLAGNKHEINEIINNEAYSITWTKDGVVMEDFTNQTFFNIFDHHSLGKYTVSVQFYTDEVRVDKDGLLKSSLDYDVTTRCRDII